MMERGLYVNEQRADHSIFAGALVHCLGAHPVSYTHLDVYKRQGWLDVKQNPEFFSRFDARDFSGWQV